MVRTTGGKADDYAKELDKQWLAIEKQLKNLGWKRGIDNDKYERILKSVEESMQKHGLDSATIRKEINKQRLLDKKPEPKNNLKR